MAEYLNHYRCSICGYHWTDEWSCMCDDRCPECSTPISPYFSKKLEEKAVTEEETEESFEERLRRISDEVKADIKAGRYRGGQIHPNISAKQPKMSGFGLLQKRFLEEFIDTLSTDHRTIVLDSVPKSLKGTKAECTIVDECHHIKPYQIWIPHESDTKIGQERDGPKKPYWTQPIPKKTPETPPSDAKRQQLKAKRKK